MIFRYVNLAGGEDVGRESLLLTRHDEAIVLLEVDFICGVNDSILCSFDAKVDWVIRFQLGVKKFSKVRYFEYIFIFVLLNL